MSDGSRLSCKAELSLVCLQIHPPALMMQKDAWLCPSTAVWSMKKRNKKIWRKMDNRVHLQVDAMFHHWEILRLMGWAHGVMICVFELYFHFKAEWAFNMQLRICLSVNRSLMSCCFCSLWEGSGIIKHFQWVPRRQDDWIPKVFHHQ